MFMLTARALCTVRGPCYAACGTSKREDGSFRMSCRWLGRWQSFTGSEKAMLTNLKNGSHR